MSVLKYLIAASLLLAVCTAFSLNEESPSAAKITYPIRAAYIDRLLVWYGMGVAGNLGVPGYAKPHDYNYIIFAFWGCKNNPMDVALAWQNISMYVGENNPWGKTDDAVQKGMKKTYNDAGIKILVSAFGSTEFPTTGNEDPVACGRKLGNFVVANNLDGADIDWEDNGAMEAGKGEQWLIDFTKALREVIPNHIVSHCPQAPYFKKSYYKNGGYYTIDQEIGSLIDFYNIQFFNQGDSRYDTYTELFTNATGNTFNGTAVKQISAMGVPLKKIVVIKPVLVSDATNTGWVDSSALGEWGLKAHDDFKWFGGFGHWQYTSDLTGNTIRNAAGPLIEKCKETGKCK